MSMETSNPFAAMLAACAVAAEAAGGASSADAHASARRWWNATPPADRHGLVVRACRLAALALQSAVDTGGDLWWADSPAPPGIEVLIRGFAAAVIEPFAYAQDSPQADVPTTQQQLFQLGQLLASLGYLEERISLSALEGDFPDLGNLPFSLEMLQVTGNALETALLQPVQNQGYYPDAIALLVKDQLLAAGICYVLLHHGWDIEDTPDNAAWPPPLRAYCAGFQLLFVSCWDLILSLEQRQVDKPGRAMVLSKQHSPQFRLDDIAIQHRVAQEEILERITSVFYSYDVQQLFNIADRETFDNASRFQSFVSAITQIISARAITGSSRLGDQAARDSVITRAPSSQAPNIDFMILDLATQAVFAGDSLDVTSWRTHKIPVVVQIEKNSTISIPQDLFPPPPSQVHYSPTANTQAQQPPSQDVNNGAGIDDQAARDLVVTPTPDGPLPQAAPSPASSPASIARQSTASYATADSARMLFGKILQRLRKEVRQLLRHLEDLIEALEELKDGWQPAALLHGDEMCDADDHECMTQYAFSYFVENRKVIGQLWQKLAKSYDDYTKMLNSIESWPDDEQRQWLEQTRDDLTKKLDPEALNRKLEADAVAVFALAKWFLLSEDFGKQWQRHQARLWTAHNLALAFLDWGETCIRSHKREEALEKWWDAVEHWAPVLAADEPTVIEHWRQRLPDDFKPKAMTVVDSELAKVVDDVRKRVLILLQEPPWEVYRFGEELEAHWLYDCLLRLFRVPAGDYRGLMLATDIPYPSQPGSSFTDVEELVEDLVDMATDPVSRSVWFMVWEDREQEWRQHGWSLFLRADYPLSHVKSRHFTALRGDSRTVRLCRKLRDLLPARFNKQELIDLCFELSVDHEDFCWEPKRRGCRSLVKHCQANGMVEALASEVIKARPLVANDLTPSM